ncbi:hypothetical protein [Vreelandella olivaria]|uniref:hypothetical protein n=1 Tax=Vreelandella olivaria TaxID=390919 RepID=UPI00201F8669|nr:hypothetical protein [Halomonas olivaria]
MKILSSRRQRLLRTIGSLIDIQPSTDYRAVIDTHKTDLERLSSDWDRIGKDLERAVEKYDHTFIKSTAPRGAAEV